MQNVYSKAREEAYEVIVDWNIGNTCNFACSYCHPHFHSGTNPFPDLDKAKLFVDRIAEKHRQSNRAIRFSLTGGEPTLYRDLNSLCAHMRSYGHMVEIKTNGSLSLGGWKALAPFISSVVITHHAQADARHTEAVIGVLQTELINVGLTLSITPESFDATLRLRDRLKIRFPILWTEIQLLYKDHVHRNVLLDYTEEQLAQLRTHGQSYKRPPDQIIEHEDRTEEFADANELIHRKRNSFVGMECRIGADHLVVDQDGSVRGGWCRVGGVLGTIAEGDFIKPTSGIVCTKEWCNNPLDLSVRKLTPGSDD